MTLQELYQLHGVRFLGFSLGLIILFLANSTVSAAPKAHLALHGTGISRLQEDTRKLTVHAQTAGVAREASGFVHFTHQSPSGLSRFRGSITCLSIAADGTAQITGSVLNGVTAAGVVLAGKDYAFTIQTSTNPQTFTLPTFAASGALQPCSGSTRILVPVTQAGFKVDYKE
jgi:hypothetical protein